MVNPDIGIGTSIFVSLGIITIRRIGKNAVNCITLMNEFVGENL